MTQLIVPMLALGRGLIILVIFVVAMLVSGGRSWRSW